MEALPGLWHVTNQVVVVPSILKFSFIFSLFCQKKYYFRTYVLICKTMRLIYTWLLIILIAIQWIGGYVSVKVIYSIELERQMNRLEEQLSESLQAETGIQAHVQILEEEELDSTTVYYVIRTDSTTAVDQEFVFGHASKETQAKFALLEQLFSNFTLDKTSTVLTPKNVPYPARNFAVAHLHDIFHPDILTPPPRFA